MSSENTDPAAARPPTTIRHFIDRFRNANPVPREERQKARVEQPDFWWKHSNGAEGQLGATAAMGMTTNGAVTSRSFDPRASFASYIPDTPGTMRSSSYGIGERLGGTMNP
jgi:hypothetical protein